MSHSAIPRTHARCGLWYGIFPKVVPMRSRWMGDRSGVVWAYLEAASFLRFTVPRTVIPGLSPGTQAGSWDRDTKLVCVGTPPAVSVSGFCSVSAAVCTHSSFVVTTHQFPNCCPIVEFGRGETVIFFLFVAALLHCWGLPFGGSWGLTPPFEGLKKNPCSGLPSSAHRGDELKGSSASVLQLTIAGWADL